MKKFLFKLLFNGPVDLKETKELILLKEENTKLKKLLKECRLAIFDYPPYDLASDKIRLSNKIGDVLK